MEKQYDFTWLIHHLNDARQEILNNKLDPNLIKNKADNILMEAIRKNDDSLIKILFEKGFKINDGYLYEFLAIDSLSYGALSCLLPEMRKNNISLNRLSVGGDRGNMLIRAVKNELDISYLSLLTKNGVKWDLQDNDGNTAVHYLFKCFPRYNDDAYLLLRNTFNNGLMDVMMIKNKEGVSSLMLFDKIKNDYKDSIHMPSIINILSLQ